MKETEKKTAAKATGAPVKDTKKTVAKDDKKTETKATVKETKKAEAKVEKKPEAKAEKKVEAKDKKATVAKPVAEEEKKAPAKAERAAVTGKFYICKAGAGFRYSLTANNGQLLYESRDYKTFDNCEESIEKFKNAVATAEFKVRKDKFGNYQFNLKSPTSTTTLYIGETYTMERDCLKIVESVKRFAPTAPVVDVTGDPEYTIKYIAFEIPADVREAVEKGQGAVGKWKITHVDENDKKSPFIYLLYANNGQLLYQSREYATKDNCLNGVETFVKTLKENSFVIDSDKFGRYKFIVRSRKSTMEYLGQNYSDKQACISSAISVYKFALRTPLDF